MRPVEAQCGNTQEARSKLGSKCSLVRSGVSRRTYRSKYRHGPDVYQELEQELGSTLIEMCRLRVYRGLYCDPYIDQV